jgi:hypothetical protein
LIKENNGRTETDFEMRTIRRTIAIRKSTRTRPIKLPITIPEIEIFIIRLERYN